MAIILTYLMIFNALSLINGGTDWKTRAALMKIRSSKGLGGINLYSRGQWKITNNVPDNFSLPFQSSKKRIKTRRVRGLFIN